MLWFNLCSNMSIFRITATSIRTWTNHWSTPPYRTSSSGLSAFMGHFAPIVGSIYVALIWYSWSGVRWDIQSVPHLHFLLSIQLTNLPLLLIWEQKCIYEHPQQACLLPRRLHSIHDLFYYLELHRLHIQSCPRLSVKSILWPEFVWETK